AALALDHRSATARAVAEPARVDRRGVAGMDDLAGIAGDFRHESTWIELAAFDLAEPGLPFARQLGGFQAPIPDHGDEVTARVGRRQRLLVPCDVAARQEGLDDR